MKTMIRNAFASMILAALLLPFSAWADITTGLVGYWPFNNGHGSSTLPDNSGNGNTATLMNFSDLTYSDMWTDFTDPMNLWPYALLFNQTGEGTDTYVKVADSTSLDQLTTGRQWTLAAWVNCSVPGASEPPNAGIIAKGNLNAEAYALYMSGGNFVGIFHNGPGTGTETATSVTVPVAGTWYHVAVTVLENKGSATAEAILYVNGVRESGANSANYTTMFASSLPVTIGCRAGASGSITNAFQGTLDEVRIYDRALSASDIAQLYNNTAVTVVNNGLGYWNGLAGSLGHATLDNTSLNYCTNLWTMPVGTASSLTNLLSVENANSEQPVLSSPIPISPTAVPPR